MLRPVHLLLPSAIAVLLGCANCFAQGQDSTPGERNLLVMAQLLPGEYDNANQAYFDGRRKLSQDNRHERLHVVITRVAASQFGPYTFLWSTEQGSTGSRPREARLISLSAGPDDEDVTMYQWFGVNAELTPAQLATLSPRVTQRSPGCEYVFRRRGEQFVGRQRQRACRFTWQGKPVYTDNEITLSANSYLFVDHKFRVGDDKRLTGVTSAEPYWLERARLFHCYVDIPGVGGGRDIPFRRYDDIQLHDKGGSYWFKTDEPEPRELGISLQAVTWQVLNERNGNFNRNSLVLYVSERLGEGVTKEHGYAFTEPTAGRIGINLKWLLANCAMTPRSLAVPEL
ncbi:MAG: CpcT/CpeT family chromophore lyase [Steroidobacteraceae bacterium]